jgi:hypothetical protein
MSIKVSIYDFLRDTDTKLSEPLKIGMSVVFIHTLILYSYLYFSGKLIRYFARFKNDKEFITLGLESVTIAVIEQSCFPVYMRTALTRILADRKLSRFFTCVMYTGSHVLNFNLFYELPTILIQTISAFIMSLIYTKMDTLDAFILNMFINIFGVMLTYLSWKFLFKTRLFQGKTFIAPISVEQTVIGSNIPLNLPKTD